LLEREPTNPHDPGAVKAMADTVHIGYVERSWAGVIAYWMDKGIFYTARVQMNYKRYMVVDLRPILPPERKKKVVAKKGLPISTEDSLHGVFAEDLQ
jgi:hypothetical protein